MFLIGFIAVCIYLILGEFLWSPLWVNIQTRSLRAPVWANLSPLCMAFFVLLAPSAYAADFAESKGEAAQVFYPFDVLVSKPEYRERVQVLKSGDKIGFANGKQYEIAKLLNDFEIQRANTAVLLLTNGHVLRIPTMNTKFARDFMKDYQRGHPLLKSNGLRVPDLIDRGIDGQYLVVSYVPVVDRLSRWLKAPYGQEKRDAFMRFARETARFDLIGDFGSDQVVWDGQNWILIDWGEVSSLALKNSSQTVFDDFILYYENNEDTIEILNAARYEIKKERSKIFSCVNSLKD